MTFKAAAEKVSALLFELTFDAIMRDARPVNPFEDARLRLTKQIEDDIDNAICEQIRKANERAATHPHAFYRSALALPPSQVPAAPKAEATSPEGRREEGQEAAWLLGVGKGARERG